MSKEAFEELVNGLEFIESLTLYGRKSLKYHIKRLQEENQQLKGSLQTYEILLKANVEENKQLKEQLEKERKIRKESMLVLGEYRHYTVPTKEQNRENEDIVDKAYNNLILKQDIDKGE